MPIQGNTRTELEGSSVGRIAVRYADLWERCIDRWRTGVDESLHGSASLSGVWRLVAQGWVEALGAAEEVYRTFVPSAATGFGPREVEIRLGPGEAVAAFQVPALADATASCSALTFVGNDPLDTSRTTVVPAERIRTTVQDRGRVVVVHVSDLAALSLVPGRYVGTVASASGLEVLRVALVVP